MSDKNIDVNRYFNELAPAIQQVMELPGLVSQYCKETLLSIIHTYMVSSLKGQPFNANLQLDYGFVQLSEEETELFVNTMRSTAGRFAMTGYTLGQDITNGVIDSRYEALTVEALVSKVVEGFNGNVDRLKSDNRNKNKSTELARKLELEDKTLPNPN